MKPEAFQHRKVGRLSIWARWLWNGMLHHADDDGRLIADHGELRVRFFGYDDITEDKVSEWLGEIAKVGLVVLYNGLDGTQLAYFPDWHEQQKIDRPKPSRLPAPPRPDRAPRAPREPLKRPHRKTGRPRFGHQPSSDPGAPHHSEGLPSTMDQRPITDTSPTDRRVDLDLDRDRIGSKATTPVADATGRIAPTVEPLNGHIKAKASKPEKPSGAAGQHVRSLLDLYVELFQAKRGKKPVIAKGRDSGILASLLAALELEETQHRLRAYFNLTDPFVVKNSLGIFQSRINALGATPTAVSSCACSYPQRYGHVAPCVKADPEDPYRNLRKRPEVERHCAACRRDFQTDDRDAERCPACEKAQ